YVSHFLRLFLPLISTFSSNSCSGEKVFFYFRFRVNLRYYCRFSVIIQCNKCQKSCCTNSLLSRHQCLLNNFHKYFHRCLVGGSNKSFYLNRVPNFDWTKKIY